MKKIVVILLTITFMVCSKKDPSLVAWWNFDSIENGIVKDLTGNGLDAVSHNAVFKEGLTGNAFFGNGNGYLEVAHTAILDKFAHGITLSVWIFRDVDSSNTYNCVITRETGLSWSEYFDLAIHKNKPLFAVDFDGNNYIQTNYDGILPLHQWIHLAGTFDNKTYRLYIDGTEVASGSMEGEYIFSDENPLIIGSNTNDGGKVFHDFFYGMIEDLKIYNRALSAEEIKKLCK